jgi:hypothetical protein
VFHVFRVTPKIISIERQLSGGYYVYQDEVGVLFDYTGVLADLEPGPLTPAARRFLRVLSETAYYEIAEVWAMPVAPGLPA